MKTFDYNAVESGNVNGGIVFSEQLFTEFAALFILLFVINLLICTGIKKKEDNT